MRHDDWMSEWEIGTWLGLASLIIALVVGAGAVLAARKWGTRRGRLLVGYSSTSLLVDQSSTDQIKVTFQNIPIDKPHLVSLLIRNIGSRDITREQFDGGSPLIIGLDCTLFGIVQCKSSDGTPPITVLDLTVPRVDAVGFEPALIPRGTEWTVDCIVSGVPTPKVLGRLVDVDIAEGRTTSNLILAGIGKGILSATVGEGVIAAANRMK